jgi:hypothetical protein
MTLSKEDAEYVRRKREERLKRAVQARTHAKAKYHTDGEERIVRAISDALTEEAARSFVRIYVRMVLKASGFEEMMK